MVSFFSREETMLPTILGKHRIIERDCFFWHLKHQASNMFDNLESIHFWEPRHMLDVEANNFDGAMNFMERPEGLAVVNELKRN